MVAFLYQFTCSERFEQDFYPLVGLSAAQLLGTIVIFNVSFYSAQSKCWDRVGFYVHTIFKFLTLIIIPVIANIACYLTFDDHFKGRSPYHLIIVFYAITCVLTTAQFIKHFKPMIYDTYLWYKARHETKSKNKIVSENTAAEKMD